MYGEYSWEKMQAIFRRLASRFVGILLWVVGFFFRLIGFCWAAKTTVQDASSFCIKRSFITVATSTQDVALCLPIVANYCYSGACTKHSGYA